MCQSTSEKGIPYTSVFLEKNSNRDIRPYGFRHEEKESAQEETFRTEIRRQRDKILYTGGFRRLQDKTQVMSATLTGDHRTRLTHTLEVEQIAISVADALGLNKDLVSAIALGHDVGHTPFGHAAERALNELLKNNGGFHHPIQSAKYLWEKYGNRLDEKIYEGILAHDSDMYEIDKAMAKKQFMWSSYCPCSEEGKVIKEIDCQRLVKFLQSVPSTLEAQAVIWADKIAYITHDLEDFLHSPIYIAVEKAERNSDENTARKLCELLNSLIKPEVKISSIDEFELRDLIRSITTNLIKTSASNINEIGNLSQENVQNITQSRLDETERKLKKRYLNSLIINFAPEFRADYYKLRSLLDEKYILSSHVQRSDAKAKKIISSLYNEFVENYELTPLEIRMKIDKESLKVAEGYLSGNNNYKNDNEETTLKSLKEIEGKLNLNPNIFENYKNEKNKIVGRIVASYISTMSDTYAENMFCNLNASKDNYSL